MGHYSPRTFLRRASNELLDRYFHEQGLLKELDIASLLQTGIEPLYEAIEGLLPDRRAQVESDFVLVHGLADELGMQAILDEAEFHGFDLVTAFEDLEGFHDKALLTLLDHRPVAEVAARFSVADRLPGSYWFRRRHGLPAIEPRDATNARAELGRNLASFFRLKEGRGRECHIDTYRRGDRFYFFALPEDYARISLEYSRGELTRRPSRPAFEVVFVYDPTKPALDTFFRGRGVARLELETIFGRTVLGVDLPAIKDERVYDLNIFKHRGVNFKIDPASGIESVRVKQLRLSFLGGAGRRLTIEADPSTDKHAVYGLVDDAFGRGTNGASGGMSLALTNVTRVGLEAQFRRGRRPGRPTKTFFLTFPNGCSLGHDGRDAVLRQMLADSGIEPQAHAAAVVEG